MKLSSFKNQMNFETIDENAQKKIKSGSAPDCDGGIPIIIEGVTHCLPADNGNDYCSTTMH